MAKEYQFNWRAKLPDILLNGDVFDRYDDESNILDLSCPVRFDEFGFFMVWTPKNRDAGILDISQIWEARSSGTIKDFRVLFDLEQRGFKESAEARTINITYGQDIVTVNNHFLLAKNSQIAKEWRQAINDFVQNYKFRHTCPMQCLQKHWRSLCLATNERSRIPLKNIVKTFASGKPERMVHKCLTDLGLAGDKYIFSKRVVMLNKNTWTDRLSKVYKCGSNRTRKKKEREDLEVQLFTFEKFLRLYYKICPRTDVQELFVRLSGQREFLTKERLMSFLNEEQRDPRLNEILFPFFDAERVRQLIAKYETDESYIAQGKMSGDGFLRFLLSDENAPVFLDRTELYQEMDQPLCHYYISSSHNTYLTGRQYGGKSSTEIYRQVLLSGCRCIELDCWDGTGENKGEPIITHGKAMCTDVFFRDVLYQIRDTAFARTDFPVILSFENHCSKSNQLKMAKYCMEILGDMLLSKPLEDHPLEPGVPLPSPNRLKRKILIKNKRLKADMEKHQLEQFLREGKLDEDEDANETPEMVNAEDGLTLPPNKEEIPATEQDVLAATKEVANLAAAGAGWRPNSAASLNDTNMATATTTNFTNASTKGTASRTISAQSSANATVSNAVATTAGEAKEHDEAHPELKQNFISKLKPLGFTKKSQPILTKEEEERIFAEYNYTGATTNIHPLLSSLINYMHPVKFSGFDIAESNDCHFHMSSFSESTGLGYLKASAPEFVNYNKRQLSRIYPKGARVDSSNFLPQIFWNAGCQMVALNFQTPDVCMQLNQGKFDYNGACGYLLKPDFMRRPDRSFDPFSESPVDGVIAAHCSVRIISGHFLCDRKVGTYVEVEMYGLPTDTIRKEHRTRTVPANGLNPIYNDDPFVFRKVVLPELAVLRFAVYDENGKQLGQRILPLDGLQAGYRHISLRTESNMAMTLPTLFVHLLLKTYVPDELSGLVDALADPRAYVSAQEKRKEALHLMGVDDSDIVEVVSGPLGGGSGVSTAAYLKQQKQNGATFADGRSIGASTSSLGGGALITRDAPKPLAGDGAAIGNWENKFKAENIDLNELRKDKIFQKLLKKHQKDLEDAKKRHQKQRDVIQKQQQTNVDKLLGTGLKSSTKKRIAQAQVSGSGLSYSLAGSGSASGPAGSIGSRRSSLSERFSNPTTMTTIDTATVISTGSSAGGATGFAGPSPSPTASTTGGFETANEKKIRDLVLNQTDEWSKLVQTHEREDFELRKKQINEEFELLRKLLLDAQKQQTLAMKIKFESENKELKQAQTKKSMDDTRVIQQDRGIKTKAERDRRVKELNEKNLKLFLEERKRLGTRCKFHEDQLNKRHEEQMKLLDIEIAKAIEQEEMNHRETLLASRPESIV